MNTGDGISFFPSDVLVDIFGRLPRRALARSCCVCRTWRALISAHNLNPPLLPLPLPPYFPRRPLGGIFFCKTGYASKTCFFAPPGSRRLFFPYEEEVDQSCNGLLLLYRDGTCVLNPATGRCSRLPSLPPQTRIVAESLAFDPAVSLHYDVFLLEELAARPNQGEVPQQLKKPQVVRSFVYSSSTERWENREFVPGRCAPGHLYDAVATPGNTYSPTVWSSVYWRGSIYMHCRNDTLMVLRPSCGTYDMVQLPGKPGNPSDMISLPWKSVLASYERGIHYVERIDKLQLRVWTLNESTYGQLWWTLAYDVGLNSHCHMIKTLMVPGMVRGGPWGIVGNRGGPTKLTKDDDYYDHSDVDDADYEEEDGDGCGYSWNSFYSDEDEDGDGDADSWDEDKDNFIDIDEGAELLGPPSWRDYCEIVGFHPHKNALILIIHSAVVVYHLDTSRMQYLGHEQQLDGCPIQHARSVTGAFTYRPCYADVLPDGQS
ncbi:uncharacterized protein LOC124659501 [Lolium rigidum]|uniref:uncharacterized protein LOC124659501 n=1 Tax=Lolium rigidum TaxID=89674 RepID=UPI001F5C9C36|nr:uncharacterized protein LOC124659501 [Lolium rigidum]XP_047053328.1 uncharacterized protein LOC124659501 [Lolium rigidum]XP_047053329.1 uncharacterized protein LOC124659501 [Lolium rigidum]